MRVIFMGTPEFAIPVFDALVDAGHDVACVYTQPPRPAGRRGRGLVPSMVEGRARSYGIEVRSPTSLRQPVEQERFAAIGADVAVVAAYGLILPPAILAAPRLGCLNVHGSLLPRWRGAAPIQRAIMAGDAETGACIMQMEAGLDTGPVLLRKATHIGIDAAPQIAARLARIGADLMVRVLACPDAYPSVPQDAAEATYAAKIDKAEARLDFTHSAPALARRVQALTPYPGAWFAMGEERVKVHRAMPIGRFPDVPHPPGVVMDLVDAQSGNAYDPRRGQAFAIACADGYLVPQLLQRAGKAWVDAADFLRGAPQLIGQRLA